MDYRVEITPRARKELERLDPLLRERVLKSLILLYTFSPRTPNVKKLEDPLSGYRLRIGEYRALFEVHQHSIMIHRIIHRKDAYRS